MTKPKPKPKYKVGQKLHAWSDGMFLEITIDSINRDLDTFVYCTNDMGGWSLSENSLFTSKAALIDAQWQYWGNLRIDAVSSSKTCPKCGMQRLSDGICWDRDCDYRYTQRHQPELDVDRYQENSKDES